MGDQDNYEILKEPNEEEIRNAMWGVHPLKSLGPDGYPGVFYRLYWSIIKDKVMGTIKECFRIRSVSDFLNRTYIVLIPKNEKAVNFSNFRPISICNFSYKVISKILACGLQKFLKRIISLNQGAFIEGRRIVKNTILEQEIARTVKMRKKKNGLLVIKLDMKKAYDKM